MRTNTPQSYRHVAPFTTRHAAQNERKIPSQQANRSSTRAKPRDHRRPVRDGDAGLARKERPHPGAQLRITDVDGHRITAFATNTCRGQLPDLELRHRRRARCEDRIRIAKDTGLTNLPLVSFTQKQIWCAIVMLAVELTAWMQLLALANHDARRWKPKRLRHRLFTIPATLARTARQERLHHTQHHPWTHLAITALNAQATLTTHAAPT